MRHKSNHSFLDSLIKEFNWNTLDKLTLLKIVIMADSPNSVKMILKRNNLFTKRRYWVANSQAKQKRDHPDIFWKRADVQKAFYSIPIINGINVQQLILKKIDKKYRTALYGNAKQNKGEYCNEK